ncbi:formimidoyltransferase-cyclodeaminase isoform X3 [Oryzias latipes]|uniref:formimidoyltransferase-cyclodeaminase isoform X3 n=1 Tax=Oryzias latipes TaxID=8090 RepID=UPI0009DA95D3|nr:formimidoyltransferase-cyclodeaminase isoform X3 [Oryzias latipes]
MSPWKNTTCLLPLFPLESEQSVSGCSSSRSLTLLGSQPGTPRSLCSFFPRSWEELILSADVITFATVTRESPTATALRMSSSILGRQLVACLLNISEARRKDLVETVARAALYNTEGVKREGTTVLNIFNDYDYNRSVITIVASIGSIREAVLSACVKACGLINMCTHTGVHPCLGAVDLIPIYPLGEEVGIEDCAQEARAVAQGLTESVQGTSAFLFGWADSLLQRGLAQRRKEMGWFKKTPDMQAVRPDVGPQPQRRYGLTGVGASPYVMNCNVTINTQDISVGRSIATAIRESTPGGLPGVQIKQNQSTAAARTALHQEKGKSWLQCTAVDSLDPLEEPCCMIQKVFGKSKKYASLIALVNDEWVG